MDRLAGKVAIVTGAARGQGAMHAQRFVEEGARVVLGDILDEPGAQLADALGPAALYAHLDVSREADWDAARDLVMSHFGRLDVLVNNAGIFLPAALEDHTREQMQRQFEVNQLGPYLGILACWRAIARAGGGSIINITSVDAHLGSIEQIAYTATKWALRGITKCAALELAPYKVRVNSLAPGPVLTPAADGIPQESLDMLASMVPLKRFGVPLEMANAAVYFASDESTFTTGSDLLVDGGLTSNLWTTPDVSELTFQRTELEPADPAQ